MLADFLTWLCHYDYFFVQSIPEGLSEEKRPLLLHSNEIIFSKKVRILLLITFKVFTAIVFIQSPDDD